MNILLDINHPAHVHYFRNIMHIMQSHGHTFVVVNRDDKMINQLLDYYNIKHYVRNKRPQHSNGISSMWYLFLCLINEIRFSMHEKIDMYLGFGSAIASLTALLFRKPCVLLDDTEHNKLNHLLYLPGASSILTPFYFNVDFGKKQLRFNAYIEQLYMHSKYFTSQDEVLNELGLIKGEYVLIRYIAYTAHHDKGVKALNEETRKEIVRMVVSRYRVLISMENEFNDDFYIPYIVHFSPEKMHDVIAGAKFIVSEGATMASEAYAVGVPYVYINPLKVGYINQEEVWNPAFFKQTIDEKEVLSDIEDLISKKVDSKSLQSKLESETIDPTAFLSWFVENYPHSVEETKNANTTEDTEFWKRFK